jgi:hypothetical protein
MIARAPGGWWFHSLYIGKLASWGGPPPPELQSRFEWSNIGAGILVGCSIYGVNWRWQGWRDA